MSSVHSVLFINTEHLLLGLLNMPHRIMSPASPAALTKWCKAKKGLFMGRGGEASGADTRARFLGVAGAGPTTTVKESSAGNGTGAASNEKWRAQLRGLVCVY